MLKATNLSWGLGSSSYHGGPRACVLEDHPSPFESRAAMAFVCQDHICLISDHSFLESCFLDRHQLHLLFMASLEELSNPWPRAAPISKGHGVIGHDVEVHSQAWNVLRLHRQMKITACQRSRSC